jgi:hypothetical protein
MAVSLYTLFRALEDYLTLYPEQFHVEVDRKSTLSFRVDLHEHPPRPPLKISFVNKPASDGRLRHTLVGRRKTRHGIDGWFWGEPGAETIWHIHCIGLTPLKAVSQLAAEVTFPPEPSRSG